MCGVCVCSQSTLSQSIKQLQRTSSDLPVSRRAPLRTFDPAVCCSLPHVSPFQVKVTNILSAIDAAEYLIAHNASHVVKRVRGYAMSQTSRSFF